MYVIYAVPQDATTISQKFKLYLPHYAQMISQVHGTMYKYYKSDDVKFKLYTSGTKANRYLKTYVISALK